MPQIYVKEECADLGPGVYGETALSYEGMKRAVSLGLAEWYEIDLPECKRKRNETPRLVKPVRPKPEKGRAIR